MRNSLTSTQKQAVINNLLFCGARIFYNAPVSVPPACFVCAPSVPNSINPAYSKRIKKPLMKDRELVRKGDKKTEKKEGIKNKITYNR